MPRRQSIKQQRRRRRLLKINLQQLRKRLEPHSKRMLPIRKLKMKQQSQPMIKNELISQLIRKLLL